MPWENLNNFDSAIQQQSYLLIPEEMIVAADIPLDETQSVFKTGIVSINAYQEDITHPKSHEVIVVVKRFEENTLSLQEAMTQDIEKLQILFDGNIGLAFLDHALTLKISQAVEAIDTHGEITEIPDDFIENLPGLLKNKAAHHYYGTVFKTLDTLKLK